MKKSLLFLLLLCLLLTFLVPKLYTSMLNEKINNSVINSVKLPDNSIEFEHYLDKEHLNNVQVLVYNDTFLIDKMNSAFLNKVRNNGYKVGIVLDLTHKDDDYFRKLSDAIADNSVKIIYLQDRNSQLDYETFIKLIDLSKENGVTIGLLENTQQNGLQYPELQRYSSDIKGLANRALYTDKKDINRLDSSEVSFRLLRAVVDRGIRFNILEADDLESLKRYDNILGMLNSELSEKGYTVSSEASPVKAPAGSFYDLLLVLAFAVIIIICFQEAASIKRRTALLFIAALFAVTFTFYFIEYSLAMILLTLTITVFMPTSVTLIIYRYVTSKSFIDSFINILKLHVIMFSAFIISGLFIWLAMSDFLFRIGFVTYKLAIISYIAPLIIILIHILIHNGYSLNRIKKALCNTKSIAIMLISAVAVAVYLSRSGNFSLFPATLVELNFRMLLEKIMPVRPRLKEFIFAYPAFFLLFAVNSRKNKVIFNSLLLCSSVAGISVLNTFCHGFTSVNVSLTRAFTGFILGTVTGIIAYWSVKTYSSDRTW